MPKTIINDSKFQRRMDSLARVLAPYFLTTPCIAIAFVEDRLFITFNTLSNKVGGDGYYTKGHSVDDIKEAAAEAKKIIKGKLDLLRKFLYQFEPYKARKSALDYSHLLENVDPLGNLRKIGENGIKYSIRQRVIMDLIKLAEFYRNSPSFNPETGFNEKNISTP